MTERTCGIIVPLDVSSLDKAEGIIQELAPEMGPQDGFKVGLELTTAVSVEAAVGCVNDRRGQCFWDGKLLDIPNTVFGASCAGGAFAPWMFNVHIPGGSKMMREAVRAARDVATVHSMAVPLVLGVTVLTSLSYEDLVAIGDLPEIIPGSDEDTPEVRAQRIMALVVKRAKLAKGCGLDGAIASPHEIAAIRDACGPGFRIVTPGVRPEWAPSDDQKRVLTPGEAAVLGANYLVIGRPIVKPPEKIGGRVRAFRRVREEIAAALAARHSR